MAKKKTKKRETMDSFLRRMRLTQTAVANLLKLNRTHLSRVINSEFETPDTLAVKNMRFKVAVAVSLERQDLSNLTAEIQTFLHG